MEKLYATAQNLQDQLDDVHRHPQLLIEVLETAIHEIPFYQYADISRYTDNPMEYFNVCLEAISKQALQDARISRALPAVTHTMSAVPYAPTAEISEKDEASNHTVIEQAFYASAGRRYGKDNRRRQFNLKHYRQPRLAGSKNPSRNGETMKCRNCDSESHFFRNCPKLTKSNLVGLVIDRVSDPDP